MSPRLLGPISHRPVASRSIATRRSVTAAMSNISLLLVLIPALPLAAALVTAVLGPRVLKQYSHLPPLVGIGSAFVLSLALLFATQTEIERQDEAAASVGF